MMFLQLIKETAKEMFWEVIDELVLDVAKETSRDVAVMLLFSQDFVDTLCTGTVMTETRYVLITLFVSNAQAG